MFTCCSICVLWYFVYDISKITFRFLLMLINLRTNLKKCLRFRNLGRGKSFMCIVFLMQRKVEGTDLILYVYTESFEMEQLYVEQNWYITVKFHLIFSKIKIFFIYLKCQPISWISYQYLFCEWFFHTLHIFKFSIPNLCVV